jgi:hypothetical protein
MVGANFQNRRLELVIKNTPESSPFFKTTHNKKIESRFQSRLEVSTYVPFRGSVAKFDKKTSAPAN